jgi:hypothetical protein
MIPRRIQCVAIIFVALSTSVVLACDVPVFRYAMDHWVPGDYRCVVFHRGTLTDSEKRIVDQLREASAAEANLRIVTADVSRPMSQDLRLLWESQHFEDLPQVVLTYPSESRARGIVWSNRLTTAAIRSVVSSPAREEIAKRLLRGQCAVWVLVESGDTDPDAAAAACLQALLPKMPDLIKPPAFPDDDANTKDDPKIEFSLLRISRTDQKEEVLLNALVRSEQDLAALHISLPLAFPVFGRGRALYALVGKGIHIDNVLEACRFLVGPCGCDSERGIALPIKAPWEEALGDRTFGMGELPEVIAPDQTDVEASSEDLSGGHDPKQGDTPAQFTSPVLLRNVLIAIGVLTAAVFIAFLAARKRVPRN